MAAPPAAVAVVAADVCAAAAKDPVAVAAEGPTAPASLFEKAAVVAGAAVVAVAVV